MGKVENLGEKTHVANKNETGGRDVLIAKKNESKEEKEKRKKKTKEERIVELEAQLEKMSWTEHNKIQTEQNRANLRTRKQ